MKAITVFDLDRTLLTEDKRLAPENRQALAQLRQNGVLPVIATGRDYFEVQDIIAAGAFTAIVSANGGEVSVAGRKIAARPLPVAAIRALQTWAAKTATPLAFSYHDGITLNRVSPLVTEVYHHVRKPTPPVDAFDPQTKPITKGLLYLRDEPASRPLEAQVKQVGGVDFYRNSNRDIDLVAAGVTKAAGIATLRRHLHAENVPVYAFGDGHNDVHMLQAATVGIAMGNAAADVQAQADYVTAAFDAGGIVAALRHFGLL